MAVGEIGKAMGDETARLLSCKTNAECVGRFTGDTPADLLLFGSVGKIGDTYYLNLNLVDKDERNLSNRVDMAFSSPSELRRRTDTVVAQLFGWEGAAPRVQFRLRDGEEGNFVIMDFRASKEAAG